MADPRLSLLWHQLSLAYDRRSWHGPNLRGSLRGVSLEEASYRPLVGRHNVWELVVHCAYWKYRLCRLLLPTAPSAFSVRGSDWFERPLDRSSRAWTADLALLDEWHAALRGAVQALDPDTLDEVAVSGDFTLLELVSGGAAHDLYHAGQVRLLRRMYRQGRDRDAP